MKTSDAARGKWRAILTSFGIDGKALDGRHHPCPCTGEGEDRFRFSDQNGTGDYFCACSQGGKGGFGLLECKTGRPFRELAAEVDAMIGNVGSRTEPRAVTYADQLRAIAKPAARSRYLESRGLEVAPGLLWAKGIDYRDDGKIIGQFDAMLAPIIRKGEWQTFHVTYLENGGKASVPCPRKILPGGSISGGGIELYPASEVMGVAEGIETAIAAKILFDCPTHATISADGMAKWEMPSLVRELHIFADHDENMTGHRGAYTLANRAALRGVKPIVHMPKELGDWNDVLIQSRAAA
jgi:putative DNA primase/helicase